MCLLPLKVTSSADAGHAATGSHPARTDMQKGCIRYQTILYSICSMHAKLPQTGRPAAANADCCVITLLCHRDNLQLWSLHCRCAPEAKRSHEIHMVRCNSILSSLCASSSGQRASWGRSHQLGELTGLGGWGWEDKSFEASRTGDRGAVTSDLHASEYAIQVRVATTHAPGSV